MSNIYGKIFSGEIKLMKLENESWVFPHSHEYLELVYILGGTAQHNMGGIETTLKKGDYFVIDYKTEHQYISKEKNLTIINCLFLPEFLDKNFLGARSFNDLVERYFFRIARRKIKGPASNQVFSDNGNIAFLIEKMYNEYEEKKEGYLEILKNCLAEIIIHTVRQIGSDNSLSDICASVLDYIQREYMNEITLGSVCKELNYSLPYVSAKFKRETGETFISYLQNVRIEKACALLLETGLSVSEVAEQVGYNNIKFFNKVFKKVTKTTPQKYRSQG